MIKRFKFIVYLIYLINFLGCNSTKRIITPINGINYTNVLSYKVNPNDKNDDRYNMQIAFNKESYLYFPKGEYYIKTKSDQEAYLLINEFTKVNKIHFEDGAIIVLDKNASSDYIKPAIIGILPRTQSIQEICISGLKVDGQRQLNNLHASGIVAYSPKGVLINNLILENISITNTGSGIHSEAVKNKFYNIRTTNCLSHGLGFVNSVNPNVKHYLTLKNYVSTNDQAYGIDFSGAEIISSPTKAYDWDQWEGNINNIKIINSHYGVKTAGFWNLTIDSLIINGSQGNGFYLSKDAPGKKVILKNTVIKNCKNNGLYLAGNSGFEGKNIQVENCSTLCLIEKTNSKIDGLVLDGKEIANAILRMGTSEVLINNFEIKNSKPNEEYSIWVQGKNIILSNGKLSNIHGIAPIILHENSEKVLLENIQIINESNSQKPKYKYSLVNIKKSGEVTIKNCPFVDRNSILDQSKSRNSY